MKSGTMDGTPKITRKSLSLGPRKNSRRRNSSSPRNQSPDVQFSSSSVAVSGVGAAAASPSAISNTDCGVECTPPHKKFNFDDSFEYSPYTQDCSFSPTAFLSQTSAESPEVGWKWSIGPPRAAKETSAATPDSAYAPDSSFTSAGSSSAEARRNARACNEAQRLTLNKDRQRQRKTMEQKCRADKMKMDEILRLRCAKLQERLKERETEVAVEKGAQAKQEEDKMLQENTNIPSEPTASNVTPAFARNSLLSAAMKSDVHDSINDFFNDSESDGLLLEATQQLESQIVELTQNPSADYVSVSKSEPSAVVTTPKSSHKERPRSSFYSKFFEDDSADDWFIALDDATIQATQDKSRASFQRYKSMPVETVTSSKAGRSNEHKIDGKDSSRVLKGKHNEVGSPAPGYAKNFKRYASTHTMSPSSSSCK